MTCLMTCFMKLVGRKSKYSTVLVVSLQEGIKIAMFSCDSNAMLKRAEFFNFCGVSGQAAQPVPLA